MTIETHGFNRRAALMGTLAALSGTLLGAPAPAMTATAPQGPAKRPQREAPRFDDPVWNREQSARLEAHTDGRQAGYRTGTF
jgi:hypothetical protein